MIAATDLVKDFGRTRAVAGVSFEVAAGEIMGLLGPNGSGKTTIMRILTGFFPPTAGTVTIDGLDVERHPLAVRERIGYLPENVVLYPDLTVARFLRFCAEVKGIPAAARRARIDEVIGACGLTDVAAKLIGKLSKGYRQRVGIAQAIIHRPRVLILDEPTVGLDPRQIVEIRALIKSLAGSTTVLLSTHILPEVGMTCGRVIIIDYGRIIAEDTALGLTQRIRGSDETRVRVAGPRADVLAALATVAGIDELREETPPAPVDERAARDDAVVSHDRVVADAGVVATDAVTVVARSAGGDAVRRDIAALVVARGWGLLELRPIAMSLEDLFVRLVRDERVGADAERAAAGDHPGAGGRDASA